MTANSIAQQAPSFGSGSRSVRAPIPTLPGVMRGLAQRLMLVQENHANRIFAFIAARSGEGTSTVAHGFARALTAETQHKVLILDAGPLSAERFMAHGIDPSLGIVDALALGFPHAKAAHQIGPGVHLARLSGREENRSLTSRLVRDDSFWQALRMLFGVVIIDAPAWSSSFDGITLAARADAAVMVVEAEVTRRQVAEKLRDTLHESGAKLIGAVMNKRRFYIPEQIYKLL